MYFLSRYDGIKYSLNDIQNYSKNVASEYFIPENIFLRLIHSESSFNPNAYNSEYGAAGIAQFIPSTAREKKINPYDWKNALNASAKYLTDLYKKYGDWTAAVGAYKGKSGSPAVKSRYAYDKLNERKLTLTDGTKIEPVSGSENGVIDTVKSVFSTSIESGVKSVTSGLDETGGFLKESVVNFGLVGVGIILILIKVWRTI